MKAGIYAISIFSLLSCGEKEKHFLKPKDFGFEQAHLNHSLILKSISTTNTLLEIADSKYRICDGWLLTECETNEIPVYLITGKELSDSQYIYVPEEENARCIFVNDKMLKSFVHYFNINIDSSRLQAAHVLVISLLHELGHIKQKDSGSPLSSEAFNWEQVLTKIDSAKNRELIADIFAADVLKKCHSFRNKYSSSDGMGMDVNAAKENINFKDEIIRSRFIHELAICNNLFYSPFYTWSILNDSNKVNALSERNSYSHYDLDTRMLVIQFMITNDRGKSNQNLQFTSDVLSEKSSEQKYLFIKKQLKKNHTTTDDIDLVFELLEYPDFAIRYRAAVDLKLNYEQELTSQRVLPKLYEALEERNGEVRGISYLFDGIHSSFNVDLLRYLDSPKPSIRGNTLVALIRNGSLGIQAVRIKILSLQNDPDSFIRERIQLLKKNGAI